MMHIIVPYDFTPITRTALNHAIRIAGEIDGEITLLHIIKSEKDRAETEENFKNLLASLPDSRSIKTYIKVGDIFSDINGTAEALEAQLIVMGTHGARGLQKLFGSYAIRVISKSKIPYIVTQNEEPKNKIEEVILPLDLTHESIQVVRFAVVLAKTFHAKIHLVGEFQKDEWLANKVRNNLNLAKLALKKAGIDYVLDLLEGSDSFQKKVINYGQNCGADFIAVTYFSDSILPQFDTFAQDIITNELRIPVLIANGNQVAKVNSQFSFITI